MYMDNTQITIESQVKYYTNLGFKPVPVAKNAKHPIVKNYLQEEIVWTDYNCNLGLQNGKGNIFSIDADNDITVNFLESFFEMVQVDVCKVRTKRGYHYWLLSNSLIDKPTYKVMKGDYKGEIRMNNTMTIVPPSEVDGFVYKVVSGSFDQLGCLSEDQLGFLLSVLTKANQQIEIPKVVRHPKTRVEQIRDNDNIPLNNIHVKFPRIEWTSNKSLVAKMKFLQEHNSEQHKGKSFTLEAEYSNNKHRFEYKSRSHVFQSVVLTLIRFGYNEDEIYAICKGQRIVPHDNELYGVGLSIDKAISYLLEHSVFKTLQEQYYQQRNLRQTNDELVYKYLLTRGMQFLTFKPSFTKSDISKFTGIRDFRSIQNSLTRLEDLGFIENQSRKNGNFVTHLQVIKSNVFITCNTDTKITNDDELHIDLNIEKTLGKSYQTLLIFMGERTRLDVKNILNLTDANRRTIYRHLEKLVNFKLLEKDGKLYGLAENWDTRLYELGSDHFHENYLRLQAQKERYKKMQMELNLYHQLKEKHGAERALEIIKNKQEYVRERR